MTVSTLDLTHAPVTQAPARRNRAVSPATNMDPHNSPLVTEGQRAEINATLEFYGAAPLRATHATETVARKAIRVALRATGMDARDARDIATALVREAR